MIPLSKGSPGGKVLTGTCQCEGQTPPSSHRSRAGHPWAFTQREEVDDATRPLSVVAWRAREGARSSEESARRSSRKHGRVGTELLDGSSTRSRSSPAEHPPPSLVMAPSHVLAMTRYESIRFAMKSDTITRSAVEDHVQIALTFALVCARGRAWGACADHAEFVSEAVAWLKSTSPDVELSL